MPADSFPFPTYSGLLDPKHYHRIGNAIWLFLWCISSTTKEVEKDGVVWGIVLGNKPQKLSDLAAHFDVSEKTIARWLETLEKNGYIRVTRAPYGLILTVRNSKKFKYNRVDKNVHSQERDQTNMSNLLDKNVHSEMRDRTNLSGERTELSTLSDKNVRSNKDITEDITKDINNVVVVNRSDKNVHSLDDGEKTDADIIADYFMFRRGKPGRAPRASDYREINKVLASGVTLDEILRGIDQAFDEYVPNYPGDTIEHFAYCKKVILGNFYRDKARKEAKNASNSRNHRGDNSTKFNYDELSL